MLSILSWRLIERCDRFVETIRRCYFFSTFFSEGVIRKLYTELLFGESGWLCCLILNDGVCWFIFWRFRAAFPWAGADPITIFLDDGSLDSSITGDPGDESPIVISVDYCPLSIGIGIFLKLPVLYSSAFSNYASTRVSLLGLRIDGLVLNLIGGLLAGAADDLMFPFLW